MRVLVDFGSTSNYIDAWECTTRRIKNEAEDQSGELKMADGTVVKPRVEFSSCLNVVGTEVKFSPGYFPI